MFTIIKKEIQWGGRTLTLETGKIARQSNGSVTIRYGDTIILCAATAAKKAKEGIDFFPLTVNYTEKTYATGKIPGGFFKREGRNSEKETLTARLIDRPIRPMFPESYKNETQIVCTVLSYDKENDSDIIALIGASAALAISEVPFQGPIAASRVGLIDGELVLNPTIEQLATTSLDLVVAGTEDSVLVVESEASELTEEKILEAVKFGQESFKPVIKLINDLVAEAGKPKWEAEDDFDTKLFDKITKEYKESFISAYKITEKLKRQDEINLIRESICTKHIDSENDNTALIEKIIKKLEKLVVREKTFNNERIDNRKLNEIRAIQAEVNVLPRVHGSALFTRGETQALAVVTLGSADDEQIIDDLNGNYKDNFMLHYNFPPYSVGEVGMLRAPGRREIGHGKLAKRALSSSVLESNSPYTIRIVSEITESNGSSSMATVCASSMSLMDAGIKIKKPIAGIAMGLVKEGNEHRILSDIMGDEDHLGDMDFKVAGTEDGISALQMDIKIKGITFEIFKEALNQAKEGRQHILKEMSKAITSARNEMNDHVPVMTTMKIAEKKIREVIGQGGKVIKKLCEDTDSKISIEDDGTIQICAPNKNSAEHAIEGINNIVAEPEVGQIYTGKVKKITDYGAFVEFMNNHSGLIHISEFADKRISSVAEFVSEGDTITFKVIAREGDRLRLSYKAANNNEEDQTTPDSKDSNHKIEEIPEDNKESANEDNKTTKKKKRLFW